MANKFCRDSERLGLLVYSTNNWLNVRDDGGDEKAVIKVSAKMSMKMQNSVDIVRRSGFFYLCEGRDELCMLEFNKKKSWNHSRCWGEEKR